MPDKEPDSEGWYHFDNMGEFDNWIERLPPETEPVEGHCHPVKRRVGARYIPICRGSCEAGRCETIIHAGPGDRIAFRCECR
jgi:hypothetical protein